MSRSWGLAVLALLSFLVGMQRAVVLRFWKDLPLNPAGDLMWLVSPYLPFLWLPLMGLAILLYRGRAAWLLITLPFTFLPFSWLIIMLVERLLGVEG